MSLLRPCFLLTLFTQSCFMLSSSFLHQLILISAFPQNIPAVCCVGGQAIRLWFFQPWNYLVSVHSTLLFFFPPSHDLMLTCDFSLQIFFGTVRSALTLNHAPYHVDLFWTCNGDASFSSGLLQKAPFGQPFLKITFFHDSSNPSVASKEDEPIPMQ